MDNLRRSALNTFAGWDGDRLVERRGDATWLETALADPATCLVPVWQARSLVCAGPVPRAVVLKVADWAHALADSTTVLLGCRQQRAYFALDIGDAGLARRAESETGAAFRNLHRIGSLMQEPDASLLAYARAMLHWHRHHAFCANCGQPSEIREAGHLRACPGCDAQEFPRLDPAVIVLVESADRCLLGRQAAWDPGRYSTVAGFVEPGETLEAAVAREVREETGVDVDRVDYQSSQPWPFPSSIMLGFRARARTGNISVGEELERARWFSRPAIRTGLIDGSLRLPPPLSIAFRLIEDWYDEGGEPLRSVPNWKTLWPTRR